MKRVWLSSMLEDLEGVEQTGGESCIVALYFFDITELLAFKQENYEQKPAVGLLYMDNYDEVMESVEDIRAGTFWL